MPAPPARSRRTARPRRALLVGHRVYLRRPAPSDEAELRALARASRSHHGSYASAPDTPEHYAHMLRRARRADRVCHWICRLEDDAIVGACNLTEIVRANLNSAYMGYYGHGSYARQGYMTEGLRLVLRRGFEELRLHRVEANIQPENERSIALAERVGFHREGYSPRYVKIAGRWRDHVRFAMLAEEWRGTWSRADRGP